jgi:hypothetical protein
MITNQQPDRREPTSEELSKLLTGIKGPRGRVVSLSGVAQRDITAIPRWTGWSGESYVIPAFPPGQVAWMAFSIGAQILTLQSPAPANGSHSNLRVDFDLEWRWELIANPFYFPEPRARFATEFGRFVFYTSIPPGGHGFDAAWIVPGQTTVITGSKESDPSPLELLLATKVDGAYRLWFRHQFPQLMANGVEVPFFTVTPPPEPPRWSAVIILAHDVIDTADVAVSAPSVSPT